MSGELNAWYLSGWAAVFGAANHGFTIL